MSPVGPKVPPIMATPNPWRVLRALPHLIVKWTTDMPPTRRGSTNGRTIWLRKGLTQSESRSTLAHELEHIRRGQTTCQDDHEEARVRHHAARRLLPDMHLVIDALVWARGCTCAAAEELWVDRATLLARLDPHHLHPAEKALLQQRTAVEAEDAWA